MTNYMPCFLCGGKAKFKFTYGEEQFKVSIFSCDSPLCKDDVKAIAECGREELKVYIKQIMKIKCLE
jgi:hypothetical protein